ncbi:MAG: MFS transporter [Xanthobacteraceae bacterium]|nr:MFS transporter [Xanthobacteraceae bacterium]
MATHVLESSQDTRDERRALAVAGGAHLLHDGYTDLIYLLLPIWQPEFSLSFAAVGVLRALYTGTMAAFQVPATLLADRLGTVSVLAAGTALAGAGYLLAGLSSGLPVLVLALILGGIGSSTQHPLASALVAQAFAGPRSLRALGTYNFTGDLGKMTVPLAASLLLLLLPWRPTVAIIGALGIAGAAAILLLMPRLGQTNTSGPAAGAAELSADPPQKFGFALLLAIGLLDSATRMAFLTYLPFLLTHKGASVATVGIALTLVFAGGAAGKLACAFIGARIGVVATVFLTEGLTTALILALLPLRLELCLVLLPVLGLALNGTSSVLYGSVPVLVRAEQRARAFGIFYTGVIGAGAAAPVLFGLVGDALGVTMTLAIVALMPLFTLVPALVLRPSLAR